MRNRKSLTLKLKERTNEIKSKMFLVKTLFIIVRSFELFGSEDPLPRIIVLVLTTFSEILNFPIDREKYNVHVHMQIKHINK